MKFCENRDENLIQECKLLRNSLEMLAKIAKSLASQGKQVLLATTDPAAHIRQVAGEGSKYLELAEIDPNIEVEKYRNDAKKVHCFL